MPQYQRPPSNHVESRPLGQPQYHAQPPYQSQPQYQAQPQYQQPPYQPAPNYQQPQYQQPPYQQSQHQPPAPARQDVTGSVSRPVVAQPQTMKNWDWNGGTPVTVARGETIQTLARRHNVPALAIAEANGMSTGTPIYPGQRLVIPKDTNGRSQTAAVTSRPAVQPQPAAAPLVTGSTRAPSVASGQHTVGPGETMYSIARRYKVSPAAIAKTNNLAPHHMVKVGERLTIPGAGGSRTLTAAAQPAPAPVAASAPVAQPAAPAPQRVAAAPQPRAAETLPATNSARVITPAKENPVEDSKADATETGSTSGSAGFRWPARGRVIAGFGPKPTGQQNDGINLAVPEGTPIRASDDGVVAYSGNELKGYGNLVLVRHSNGYVTAYAHASELNVKRGDNVRRGQVIGKSGQTGNVTSPQLHFEIRKGATPVDPMPLLASN